MRSSNPSSRPAANLKRRDRWTARGNTPAPFHRLPERIRRPPEHSGAFVALRVRGGAMLHARTVPNGKGQ